MVEKIIKALEKLDEEIGDKKATPIQRTRRIMLLQMLKQAQAN